ncbi:MAG: flavodoxin [Intestinibaculum porci]|uniref:flavodoxin n=1 Tax=Intestinibaculum porci TaxID=2487118 RepID=UPI003F02237B
MNKKSVTYFFATGTTRRAAVQIVHDNQAQLLEIRPQSPYTSADLNWHDPHSRSSLEQQDPQIRIPIKKIDVSDVTELWIGFPIWWYTYPRIIDTFLESADMTAKTIYLFATSGGSSIEKAWHDLQLAFPRYNFVDAKKY